MCFLDLFSLSSLLLLLLICHRILTFFQAIQLLRCNTFFTLTAALRPWSYKSVCDTRATHCPCQLRTGPISSRHTHMSMLHTPLFTSSLMTVPSRLFRMCGLFSSITTAFTVCTTFRRSPTHDMSWCICAGHAAIVSCFAILLVKGGLFCWLRAAVAASTADERRSSAVMQMVSKRWHSFVDA